MVVPTMDKLPRVPDTHGDVIDEKVFSDLYIRTSWVDANIALDQIKRVSRNAFTYSSRKDIRHCRNRIFELRSNSVKKRV